MLQTIVIKEITGVYNIYSKAGTTEHSIDRKSYGISFCKSGKITYKQNGEKYVSDNCVAVLLPKGASYEIFRQETGFFPVINFECDDFYTDTFLLFPIKDPAKLIKWFEELCLYIRHNEKLKAKSVFYRILSEIDGDEHERRLPEAEEFIYRHLSDPALNNRQIADHLKISENYLNRKFTDTYATSPKKFIEKVRMETAVQLLFENEYSIGEIAGQCGYSGIYTFSRAFKNRMGVSPTAYKKTIGR